MLDHEQLQNALDRVGAGADVPCPICRHNGWSPGSEYVLLHAIGDDVDVEVGRGYLAYQLRCDTCGFMRLHSVQTLDPDYGSWFGEPEDSPGDSQDSGDETGEPVENR